VKPKPAGRPADPKGMRSVLLLAGVALALGLAFGAWALINIGGQTEDVLDRDEHNSRRGRQSGEIVKR